MQKKKKPKKKKIKAGEFELSAPTNFRQTVHVDFNSESGFSGLPSEWDALLKSSDISKEDCIQNSNAVISALEFYENGYKPANKPGDTKPMGEGEKPSNNGSDVPSKNEPEEKEDKKGDPVLRGNQKARININSLRESEWIDDGDPETMYSDIIKVGEGYVMNLINRVCT